SALHRRRHCLGEVGATPAPVRPRPSLDADGPVDAGTARSGGLFEVCLEPTFPPHQPGLVGHRQSLRRRRLTTDVSPGSPAAELRAAAGWAGGPGAPERPPARSGL